MEQDNKNVIQLGSEYQPFEDWKHLNKKFGFQMVWYSNGRSMGYVLCTRPTIQIPDQYIIKQDVASYLSGIQMALENQTNWHPTSFRPFKYQTSSVFRSCLHFLNYLYRMAPNTAKEPLMECLIREMKPRQCIWNKNSKDYKNAFLKSSSWNEILSSLKSRFSYEDLVLIFFT